MANQMRMLLETVAGKQAGGLLRSAYLRCRRLWEAVLWGGERRERLLLRLLDRHYASRFRRDWVLSAEPPHFFNQRIGMFKLAFSDQCQGVGSFYRGFFAAQVVRAGDRVLDIGCGDGFFTRRFLAPRAGAVDAIDVEPTAIAAASTHNAAPSITYGLQDAVQVPFPASRYDVIVWDGAIGHFPAATLQALLKKISAALATDGVFVGSESLGLEGSDHLQFFAALEDLAAVFQPWFKHVEVYETTYPIGQNQEIRREGYWRCANDPARLKETRWRQAAVSAAWAA